MKTLIIALILIQILLIAVGVKLIYNKESISGFFVIILNVFFLIVNINNLKHYD